MILTMQSITRLNYLGHLWHNAFIPGVISLIVFAIVLFIILCCIMVAVDNGHMPSDFITIAFCLIMILGSVFTGVFIFSPQPIKLFEPEVTTATAIKRDKKQIRNHHEIKILRRRAYNKSKLSHEHHMSRHKSCMYYLSSEHDLDKVHDLQHYDEQTNHKYIHVSKPQWYNY